MRCFSLYMSERQQILQFKDTLSIASEVITGVTRGSILGQLFFIVSMNDMPLNTTTNVTVDIYIDDSTVIAKGMSIQSVIESLNNDLQEICKWCNENRMDESGKKHRP